MSTYFCPGHVTCFFQPVRTRDIRSTGSRGAGLRLNLGSRVTLAERDDGEVNITMDGVPSEAPVTRCMLRHAAPGRGFDVTVDNDLPVGQGFGMSASGAIAAAMCVCELLGKSEEDAFLLAHQAEVEQGGGLGDVAAIQCLGHQPVRVDPGMSPYGKVVSTQLEFDSLTLAVIGGELSTASVINDSVMQRKLAEAGSKAVDEFLSDPTTDNLFRLSRRFSREIGMETSRMKEILDVLNEKGRAGMCMLGHSIFTDVPAEKVTEMFEDVEVFECSTYGGPVTRTE